MSQQHKENGAFKQLPRAQGEGFSVSHFAGPVGYHIDGFVEKSRDALPGERPTRAPTPTPNPNRRARGRSRAPLPY